MGRLIRQYRRKQKRANRKADRRESNSRVNPIPKRPSGGVLVEGSGGKSISVGEPGPMAPDKMMQKDNLRKKKGF
jgi:hypothetical protein